MTLRYTDGFDAVAVADLPGRWAVGPNLSLSVVAGRLGGGAVRLFTRSPSLGRVLDPQPTWVVGVAVRVITQSSFGAILSLRDAGADQLTLQTGADGVLSVRRGDWQGTVLGSTAAGGRWLRTGLWYYLEFKATIHPSAGAYELRVDGEVWLSGSGANTRSTANSTANQVALGSGYLSGDAVHDYDDLYVCDTAGAVNNDFLGDVRVQTLWPSGAGAAADFALSAGTAYASYRLAVLADAPLHFWELQETSGLTAADTGAGTASAAAFTTRAFAAGPLAGTATDLAASSHASAPHQADMNLTGDMTAECWAYLSAAPTADGYVVSRGAANAWTFCLGVSSGGLPRWAQGSAAANGTGPVVPVGRWFHYAAVRLGASMLYYVEGAANGTSGVGGTAASGTNPTLLGALSSGAAAQGNPWAGRLAHVALYASALPAAKLANHAAYAPWRGVADATPNADATYAADGTVGHRSTFVFEDTPATTAAIKGVQLVTVARKDDAGVRSLAPVVRSGTTNYTGTGVGLPVSYAPALQVYEADPATGAAWTKAGVDGAEFGVEVTA